MSKFDTHGGHFTPTGYMKVTTGGSHEENPNGGVQVGMDENGIPNLLEEGEPVYNDYVYSDNIYVTAEMAETHNLPKTVVGKLYSEAADMFVDEASEMTVDPIANNGMNAMLVRLMEAQEEQKQMDEQAELEKALSELSPEEMEELNTMLAQQQAQGEVAPEQIAPQEIVPEQVPTEMPVQAAPEQMVPEQVMPMSQGGCMKRYDAGGPILDVPPDAFTVRDNTRTPFVPTVGFMPDQNLEGIVSYPEMQEQKLAEIQDRGYIALEPTILPGIGRAARFSSTAAKALGKATTSRAGKLLDKIDDIRDFLKYEHAGTDAYKRAAMKLSSLEAEYSSMFGKVTDAAIKNEALNLLGKTGSVVPEVTAPAQAVEAVVEETAPVVETASKPSFWRAVANPLWGAGKQTAKAMKGKPALAKAVAVGAAQLGQWGAEAATTPPVINAIFQGAPEGVAVPQDTTGKYDFSDIIEMYSKKACGGKINRFDEGGWAAFLPAVRAYTPSRKAGGVSGTYAIDNNFNLGDYGSIKELEGSDPYKYFTDYVLKNPTDENVLSYLRALDAGTAAGVPKLFDGDNLRKGWEKLYTDRRNDGKAGIYHMNFDLRNGRKDAIDVLPKLAPINPPAAKPAAVIPPTEAQIAAANITKAGNSGADGTEGQGVLPTWMRYAGIGVDVAALAANLAQPKTRYSMPDVNPNLPYGYIRMVPQEYRAIDPNIQANAILAQGNATRRAIMNSGAGPSTIAGLVAADNNLTNALGNATVAGWSDANARRNAVIGANNASEAQRANFDYQVDLARAQMLNQADQLRARYGMLVQQLNNAEDAQEAQAISTQLDAIAQALSSIGRENFVMNQVNSNDALRYGTLLRGDSYYKKV